MFSKCCWRCWHRWPATSATGEACAVADTVGLVDWEEPAVVSAGCTAVGTGTERSVGWATIDVGVVNPADSTGCTLDGEAAASPAVPFAAAAAAS